MTLPLGLVLREATCHWGLVSSSAILCKCSASHLPCVYSDPGWYRWKGPRGRRLFLSCERYEVQIIFQGSISACGSSLRKCRSSLTGTLPMNLSTPLTRHRPLCVGNVCTCFYTRAEQTVRRSSVWLFLKHHGLPRLQCPSFVSQLS